VRVRGLKHRTESGCNSVVCVAPRAGAWIETSPPQALSYPCMSHPVRVRGLKPSMKIKELIDTRSHPVRVRGLKPAIIVRIILH